MQKIPIKISTINDMPIPQYQTAGAAGFDLSAAVNTTLPPQQVTMVPTGIAVEIPHDYWLMVTCRSSLHKLGLMLANGVGVIDPDFCGHNDRICLLMYNFTTHEVNIEKGFRLAQAIIMPRIIAEFESVKKLGCNNRGGIGSTGI